MIKPERAMDLEGGGSILCPPNLGAHAEPFAGRAGKGVQDVVREEDGGNPGFYSSVSITALVCGACLKDTFLSAQISAFRPERINPEIMSVCLRQRVFHLLKAEIVEKIQSFHIF